MKHRRGFIRALSNFSKPVEEWGVSSVPVLSTSVTPRRERPPAIRSRRDSNSSRSTTSSPRRPNSVDIFESPSRVLPIRPLSIATVSTFGGWIQERVKDEDEAKDAFTAQDAGTLTLKPSTNTYDQHAQPFASVQCDHTVPKSPSASPAENFRRVRGRDTGVHPLRMHPPSPSPSLSARSIGSQNQNTSSLSHNLRKIPLPSTPSFDDAASKASRDTISTRRSRRTLPGLNIEAANSDVKVHEGELERNDRKQAGVFEGDTGLTYKHSSFPRDDGYVEAMRLWYEEKENEASDNRQHEHKAVKKAGSAGCALASVNANQRL
ncbi:hypothetical protein E8E11_000672 [Didymella keratinophila]|nr:hypothetical protein E8E11_000672 [Didymella keratinophila]